MLYIFFSSPHRLSDFIIAHIVAECNIKNAFRHGEKLPFLFSLLYYLFSGKVAGERLEKSEEYKKKKPLARLFFLARVDKKDAS